MYPQKFAPPKVRVKVSEKEKYRIYESAISGTVKHETWLLSPDWHPAGFGIQAEEVFKVQDYFMSKIRTADFTLSKHLGTKVGPIMDMSMIVRAGTVSEEQMTMCEDHYQDADNHARNLSTCIHNLRSSLQTPSDHAEFLLDVRTRTGMTSLTAEKTKILAPCPYAEDRRPLIEFQARLDHYVSMTAISPSIAYQMGALLLDVDSKYDPQMPSPSDISVWGPPNVIIGKRVLYLIDVTSQSLDVTESKMERLVQESIVKFSGLEILVVPVILRLSTADWRADIGNVSPASSVNPDTLSQLDLTLLKMSQCVIESSDEDRRKLCEALHLQIDPVIESFLDEISEMSSIPRDIEVEVSEVVRALSVDYSDQGLNLSDMALNCVEGHDLNIFSILHDLENKARDLGMSRAEDLISMWRKGVTHSMDRLDIRRAPPIPLPMGHKDSSRLSSLISYDLMFQVVHKALYAPESEVDIFSQGAAVLEDMSTRHIVHSDHVDFSRPQTPTTHFAKGVLAYVKRPTLRRRASVLLHGGKTVMLLPSERAEYSEFPERIPRGGQVKEVEVLERAPHVQILMNTQYYDEPSFMRHVSRKETLPAKKHATLMREISSDTAIKIGKEYEAMIDDLVYNVEESKYVNQVPGTFIGKMDFLFSTRASPQVSGAFGSVRRMTENRYTDLIDAEASICRGVSATLHSRLPSNTVTILNSSTHALVALAFINSPAEHFRSCAVKTLSMSTIRQKAKFGHVDMVFHEGGKMVRASMVALTNNPNNVPGDVHISGSAWETWDRNHIEWMLERQAKVAVRSASLVFSRPSLTTGTAGWLGWDKVRASDGEDYMKRETLVNATGFFSNRQQATVVMQAQRYLHQNLGGLETDYTATIKKLAGIRLRTTGESFPSLKMMAVYTVGVVLKLSTKKEILRSANMETFTVMPHLLRASSDPAINTSAYFSYLQFNNEKQWRTAYEALDVQAVWKQMDQYRSACIENEDLVIGFSKDNLDVLKNVFLETGDDVIKGSASSKVQFLTSIIAKGEMDVTSLVKFIGQKRMTEEKTAGFQGCNWFELMVGLDLRHEVGTLGKSDEFLGKDLMEFFTMRGAIDDLEFNALTSVRSYRKASAMVNLTARVINVGDKTNWPESLAKAAESDPSIFVDLYSLLLARGCGRLVPTPLIQLSDKNQAGKPREISTLKVDYGIICILTEMLAKRLSMMIPEDMITSSAKTRDIDNMVKSSQSKKHLAEGVELVYANQDKSNFGPNKRAGSMFMMAASLSPDLMTHGIFFDAISTSRGKKSRYPHGLIKESLRPVVQREMGSNVPLAMPSTLPSWTPFDESTTSGKVMAEISRQYHGTGKYGPAKTCWVEIPEGMPGQGIMGISSSIAHSSVVRYMKKMVAKKFGWSLEAKITSDDSMCAFTFRSESRTLFARSARRVVALFGAFASLIENEGKFILTSHKPEMNTVYYQGPEIIPPYWKFMNACTALHTSGNLSEDLLHCVSKGNDAVKEGASFFDGALVMAANMALCIDAHRGWTMYFKSAAEYMKNISSGMSNSDARRRCVVFFPPEVLGIPQLDASSSMMSPMGPRTASALNSALNGSLTTAYSKLVAFTPLRMPEREKQVYSTDSDSALFTTHGDVWVSTSSSNSTALSTLKTFSWKSVNGIRCQLRRRKGTLRLASEFGNYFSASQPRMLSAGDPTSLGTLISSILINLKGPLTAGDADSSPLMQMSDLMHSTNRRCLEVERHTPIASAVGPGWKTPSDVYEQMSISEVATKALTKFETMLEGMNESGVEVPEWAENIYKCLESEASYCLDYAAGVLASVIRRDPNSTIYSEHMKETRNKKKEMYRLLNMSPDSKRDLDKASILGGCLSQCVSVASYIDLPLDLRRIMVGHPPKGEMGMMDAITAANAMMNRILSSFSPGFYVIGNTSNTVLDEEMAREDWVRLSYMRGTAASLPYLPRRQNYYSSLSGSLGVGEEQDQLNDALEATMSTSLMCCLDIPPGFAEPIIGSNRSEVLSVRDYSVTDIKSRPAIRKLSSLMGTKMASALAAASGAHVQLSMDSWERILVSSSRIGWSGTPMCRSTLRGPIHFKSDHEWSDKSFFINTSVEVDTTYGSMPTVYWHTILQLDRKLPGSELLSEYTTFPEDQHQVIETCSPGYPMNFKDKDKFMRMVLTSSMPMTCGMYGTSVFLSIRPNFLRPLRHGGFCFSTLSMSSSYIRLWEGVKGRDEDAAVMMSEDFMSTCPDVYQTANVIRKGDLPFDPLSAMSMGSALGNRLRQSSRLDEVIRMSMLLVNGISRGGVPGGRLLRAVSQKNDLDDFQEEAELEEEFNQSTSDHSDEVEQVHSMRVEDLRKLMHRGEWGDDESMPSGEHSSFEKINVAEVIEAQDLELGANSLALSSRLTKMSLSEVRSLTESLSQVVSISNNSMLFFMCSLCSALSQDVVATHLTSTTTTGAPMFSHSGWEELSPPEDLFLRLADSRVEGRHGTIFGKESYGTVQELARMGIKPAGGLGAELATAPMSTNMQEALVGIFEPDDISTVKSVADILAELKEMGISSKDPNLEESDDENV